MAEIIICEPLKEEIKQKFKKESIKIFTLMLSLEDNPHKGNVIGAVNDIIIKEIRYNKFRFYFITDGYMLKVLRISDLKDLLIKFVRMSEKKDQQETIDEIKNVLRNMGSEGF